MSARSPSGGWSGSAGAHPPCPLTWRRGASSRRACGGRRSTGRAATVPREPPGPGRRRSEFRRLTNSEWQKGVATTVSSGACLLRSSPIDGARSSALEPCTGSGCVPDHRVLLALGDHARRRRLNALLGWRWADPIAALAMTWFIGKEGLEGWRGGECGCTAGSAGERDEDATRMTRPSEGLLRLYRRSG